MSIETQALAIVEEALAINDLADRAAFVTERCGETGELRVRVDRLLALDRTEFRLLPTESFARPLRVIDAIPERIGPYRVTGEIARGGMGAVVKAERDDGVFAQTVAIKFIRADLASDRARARFAAERRILARLSHPGIVRIIDGGEIDARPWLAMDFVDGLPVTEALEKRGASLDQRLDAVEAICDAVAYAHRALVVHADLKPSNVLMTAGGDVKLLDFGIARLIVGLDADESGDPYPLTKGYAAPERAVGVAPTVASDVFSLGMLMLGMLGCATPTPDSAFVPGTRLPQGQLTGDLAAIAARALAELPGNRYADAAELRLDIQRHRALVPVRARTDAGWRYAAGRFVVRHRRGLAVTAAVVVALVATTVATTLQYVRAERALAQSNQRFVEVRGIAQFMLTDLSDAMADAPGTVAARAQLAATASAYLERLRNVPDAPIDLRLDTARGYRRLSALQGMSGTASLGEPQAAARSLAIAERLLEAIVGERPNDAGALEELGWVLAARWTFASDTEPSRKLNARAATSFRKAIAIDPTRQGAQLGLLVTEKSRAYELMWTLDQPAEALPVLRSTLVKLRSIRFQPPYLRDARLLEVNLLGRIGDAIYYAGDPPQSLVPYREADAIIAQQLATKRSVVWLDKLGEAKFNISGTLGDLPGHEAAAEREAQAGIEALQRVLEFGSDAAIEKRLLVLFGQKSAVLVKLKRFAEAVDASNASIALRRQRLARAPRDPQRNRDLAVALPQHAAVLAAAGAAREACAAATEAVQTWEAIRGAGSLSQRDATHDLPKARLVAASLCHG